MTKLRAAPQGAIALALAAFLGAQPAAPSQAKFEVASIKPALPSTGIPLGLRMDKAQATFGGMSLSALISYAYGVKLTQVSGPEWLTTQRFNIVAKLPEGASTQHVPEMLQELLAERFALKLRHESKEFSVYALVAAKTGIKLTAKPDDFDPKAHSDRMAIPILSVTLILEQMFDLPVIDETKLQGQYLFPAQAIQQAMAARTTELIDSAVASLLLPAGLKLEKKRTNLPVLVVESMRQTPTEN